MYEGLLFAEGGADSSNFVLHGSQLVSTVEFAATAGGVRVEVRNDWTGGLPWVGRTGRG